MRFLDIPPFPRTIGIPDFDSFIRSRLSQKVVLWPDQAIPLVGHMGWPNDPEAHATSVSMLREWFEGSKAVPPGLGLIQKNWARVADVFSLHYELTEGGHQQRRGGPSVGKAVAVAAGSIQARGGSAANLWSAWGNFKDVAHLVTAATIITNEVRHVADGRPFGEFGFHPGDLPPFRIAILMPDFVMALGLSLQEYGLSFAPQASDEATLDPETLWRIGPKMNVVAIPPPVRKIDRKALQILNDRRAGNRGEANRPVIPRDAEPSIPL